MRRLARAASARYKEIGADYRAAGCCVQAANDLRVWAFTGFGAHLPVRDVHIVFFNGAQISDAPVLYARPGSGAPSPQESTVDGSKLFKMERDTCVWRFERAMNMRGVRAFKHVVVQLGESFLDWGFDQFLLPAGTEMRMVM